MTNFIFKSQGTYKKLVFKLEVIQTELRHQRSEHSIILNMLKQIQVELNLRSQADMYYKENDETSHQTDLDEQLDGISRTSD